jgi:hypothetical protein
MAKRYTIKQLEGPSNIATINKQYLSDDQILLDLARDRYEKTTNPYSPLSKRLNKIIDKLREKINKDIRRKSGRH